jgi:sugar lactone lactonase YvrE
MRFEANLPLAGLLAVLAACDGPVASDPPTGGAASTLELAEGWPLLPDGVELGRVLGVAVHPDGRVFVAHAAGHDSPNEERIATNPILVFDPDTGELLDSLGQDLFFYPHGLTFDSRGRLWVTDSDGGVVVRLDEQGRVELSLGEAP